MATIRAVLVKGRSSGDAVHAAAEETARELKERICQIHQIQRLTADGSGTGISPARVMYNSALQLASYSSGFSFAPPTHTFMQKTDQSSLT